MKRLPFRRGAPGQVDTPSEAPASPVLDPVPDRLPDPAKPAQNRGSWEQAALVNVAITETIKRQLNAQTPPWKK